MSTARATSTSFFSRLGKSISGILGGIALFILAILLLWWNEQRAVEHALDLAEGEDSVVEIQSIDTIDAKTHGALVHLTGIPTTKEILRDDTFNISLSALRLRRTVEMLQWKEHADAKTKTHLSGHTDTEISLSHEKVWSETLIDSSAFEAPDGHTNPSSKPLESIELEANDIHIGAYRLSDELVDKLSKFEEIRPPEPLPENHTAQGNVIFRSIDPNHPQIGDLRITFKAAMPSHVSIVARNHHGTLDGYRAGKGSAIQLLEYGDINAATMFESAKSANNTLTFGLRILGIILIFTGLNSILSPMVAVAGHFPMFGCITRIGTSLIAVVIALPVAFTTIAMAWLSHRPWLATGIITSAACLSIALILLKQIRITKSTTA